MMQNMNPSRGGGNFTGTTVLGNPAGFGDLNASWNLNPTTFDRSGVGSPDQSALGGIDFSGSSYMGSLYDTQDPLMQNAYGYSGDPNAGLLGNAFDDLDTEDYGGDY
jgi:hypothetical protein